ncbi:hypothetical protein TD95_003237 [Thielaviopsis punctulata]|uniref:alkaline phosphatase n=1 Tax=Thielaviopsis punctulata TaxID=72032 RepID=A0A0F4ZDA7_9PEZI|nr:hypothetical protein TD95_003237 [Thielaviopsis punctulata]
MAKLTSLALLASAATLGAAQTFQRLGTCPKLGCVLPPDQSDFLPGQLFDLRVEVHAPVNGSEAFNNGVPDDNFTVTIGKVGEPPKSITEFFSVHDPEMEKWEFGWYEDRFAEDAGSKSMVNVASKIYRHISITEPGEYEVTLTYYNGETTVANWLVRPISAKRKAKNVIFFIGDGMTTNMITAARLLAHKSVNGRYQSRMAMDSFPVLGHQMTHSIDSYITDSANSAASLYSGHKGTVNAMGVYVDSSADYFDDPKVETIVELMVRHLNLTWGAVSTAALSDATPTALTAHTRSRYAYGELVDQALNSVRNYTWTNHGGPDVYFGGGAEQFYPNEDSFEGKDFYAEFANRGYSVSLNKTAMLAVNNSQRALGVFSKSHMPVWLDRNVYTENLADFKNDPSNNGKPALDLPGLKDMTHKAIEILHERGGDNGFFLMSEAASIDKQMHGLDYDRALGDLMELDDTIKATIEQLKDLGIYEETLIVVSADHGHGFDVFGSADTKYLSQAQTDREKRRAVGAYQESGLSQYTESVEGISYGTGVNFPQNWEPRYAIAAGVAAAPDHREDYKVHSSGPRSAVSKMGSEYFVNPKDSTSGFVVNGTLSPSESSGVHSLTDVPVFAGGPCQELFGGVYNNIDIFFKIADCMGLGRGRTDHGSCVAKRHTRRAADRF